MIAFDFAAVLAEWPLLARGVAATVALTAVSASIGVALGVACAWARLHGPAWLKWAVGTMALRKLLTWAGLRFIFGR